MSRIERAFMAFLLFFCGICMIEGIVGCTQVDRAASAFVTQPGMAPTTQGNSDAELATVTKAVTTELPYGQYIVMALTAISGVYLTYRQKKAQQASDDNHAITQAMIAPITPAIPPTITK